MRADVRIPGRPALRWAAVDAAAWAVALFASVWLRYDFRPVRVFAADTWLVVVGIAVVHVLVGLALRLYGRNRARGTYEEAVDLTVATVLTALVLLAWVLLVYPPPVPRSSPGTAGPLALAFMFAARFLVRARATRRAVNTGRGRRALVFGAGGAGSRLVRMLVSEEDSPVSPVAFLDDDPDKRRRRIEGIRVLGGRHDLRRVAQEVDADLLVLAAPTAPAEVVEEISEDAAGAGIDVKILPTVGEVVGTPGVHDLRDVDFADFLGRRPVELDTGAIGAHLTGRRVLVTGAGGSIGSELCRQIARFSPERLVLLDRDESGLHGTQVSLVGHGLLDTDDIVLADVRDRARLDEVFDACRPQVVFHAAALKHLPLLERYPGEGWKTNVLGTANVLAAATAAGADTVVNVSTDKAADPTSVLGVTKRIGECLTAWYAQHHAGTFVSVRFGNVLGSRGSIIPAFTEQIRRGGPVTVTDPDVTRYFMLIPEACQLVLQASAMGHDGEVMVLDMGEPVRIDHLARTLIRLSGRHDVDVVYTGLRPGEKLEEELFGDAEERRATAHPLVRTVGVPALDPARLKEPAPIAATPLKEHMRGLVDAGARAEVSAGGE
ncbi:polysaccharide biosynthesis protein [Mobilicoccus pelagius]|uniref:Putative polysaccharide biosynthesis protein n=1 Tax=Mobilicoccus pelagius NBRC 104925 TaxID=1089455 RepID=H5UMU9_9MICO|nr:nucleoside-diphosphate sugar epimerase/dehydratase [Mobilicoccus pelagius]GAB47057.1 putative polysaccharide biosynthesis protein [Mobilicoccus pelagius NBRC 104925]